MLIWGGKRKPTELRRERRSTLRASERKGPREFLAFLADENRLKAGQQERLLAALENRRFDCLPVLITEMGFIPEADLTQLLASFSGLAPVTQSDIPDAAVLSHVVTKDFCQRQRVLPLRAGDGFAVVAIVDALDRQIMDAISYVLARPVEFKVIGTATHEAAVRSLYGEEDVVADGEGDGDVFDDALDRLEDLSRRAPIIRLANTIFRTAFERGATDIHVEPGENDLRVRYRVDGMLVFPETFSKSLHNGLVTRLKILASLNIAERRLPQDGRLKMVDRGRDVDVRVSVLPTPHGESVVMRLLGRSITATGFESLGLDAPAIAAIARSVEKPNGLFLVTGPTGSGKTTTLYTALGRINTATRKVITVEDPVEYRIGGVTQVQAHSDIGLTFAAALRSILRQDPDVVMIGEIRDQETARIAVQAALTGHLVLSTLHTNSAAATVTRLIDMGLEPYLVAAVLNGVIAQRLLRVLCSHCKTISSASREEELIIRRHRPDLPAERLILARPVGCPHCSGTGFRGRTVVAEALELDRGVRGMIARGVDEGALEGLAREHGMRSLAASGIERVLRHETCLEEVIRHLDVELDPSEERGP